MVKRPSELPTAGGAASSGPNASADAETAEVLRAQQGDRAALEALVRRHHEDVARVLWRFARQPADLDDLVQDTFLRALRHLCQWRADRPFVHWLRRIAANTGRDYYRRHAVRQRWAATASPDQDDQALLIEAVDPQPNPAAAAAANEVKTLLSQLTPDEAAVLTLHHLEGWGLQDIAAAYGWTHTATKLRAWRARARLRALYEPPSKES